MAVYKTDIVDIDLETGNIHRSFLNRSIGSSDNAADHFGVRVFRNRQPVDLTGVSCQGFFHNSQGENIALTSHGTVSGNMAFITLPQACYNYEGKFTLAIKLIGGGVTGTMRIIDGMVDNTNTGGAVAPTGSVPTYQEVLALYGQAIAAVATVEEMDDKIDEQITDIKEELYYAEKPVYALDVSPETFGEYAAEGYWGKKRLFDPCYVRSVTIGGQFTGGDVDCSVILCDENYTILKKSYYKRPYTTTGKIEAPINYNAEVPFYVLIRIVGFKYGHGVNSKYRTVTLKAGWGAAGYAAAGEDISSMVSESDDDLEFDAVLNIVSVNEAMKTEGSPDDVFSDNPGTDFNNFSYISTTTGNPVWGSKRLYPKGFIKTITIRMTGETNDLDVAIYITDKNRKILKKIFGYDDNQEGEHVYLVNFLATEPVYIFVRATRMIYTANGGLWGEKYAQFHGEWGTYGYKSTGETLFDSWDNSGALSTNLFAIKANYDNTVIEKYEKREKLFTLYKAFEQWTFGKKFPICVIGDSTTDGDTTTGATPNVLGTDHVDPNTYTTKLQGFLCEALNNNVLRIYNAGFSGRGVSWALQNIDAMLFENQYYADTKIAIISHGINDGVNSENRARWYRDHLSQLAEVLYDAGIQPVMMTTQAGMENHGRFGWQQMALADEITKEVAAKYNLEVMDKNKFTSIYNLYSPLSIQTIIPDGCHYSDAGHLFVAGFMFADLVPFTVWAEDGETILGFNEERIRTGLEYSSESSYRWKDVRIITPENGFKLEAHCSKTASTMMMDFWVFVIGKKPKTITSYCTTPNVQTVSIDGNSTEITSAEQVIGTLDLGIHHIVVSTGASEDVNYLGLKLADV